jgi:hypothetical protein
MAVSPAKPPLKPPWHNELAFQEIFSFLPMTLKMKGVLRTLGPGALQMQLLK